MFEARTITRHAGTVLVGQLAVMAFGIADTLIAGRYDASALAALSVGSSIYISIYVALNGLMQALLPVWSEIRGAGHKVALGKSVRQAFYLCIGVILLGTTALLFPDPWLNATQVPTVLQADVRAYLQVLAVAVGPSLLFRMYVCHFESKFGDALACDDTSNCSPGHQNSAVHLVYLGRLGHRSTRCCGLCMGDVGGEHLAHADGHLPFAS